MEYNHYYVIRTKCRADGDVDMEQKEAYSEANARYQYNTWKAAAYVDTTYPQIGICILNSACNPIEHQLIPTQYVAPAESTES